jgi:hypothetical protein
MIGRAGSWAKASTPATCFVVAGASSTPSRGKGDEGGALTSPSALV